MRDFRKMMTLLAAVVLGVAVFSLCSGCGGGGGGSSEASVPDDNTADTIAPTVTNTSVDPAILSLYGGDVVITADANDNVGVSAVSAVITKPDGGTVNVALSGTGTYSGTYTVPTNASGAAQTYSVRVGAADTSSNTAFGATASFIVLTADAPPPPPAY